MLSQIKGTQKLKFSLWMFYLKKKFEEKKTVECTSSLAIFHFGSANVCFLGGGTPTSIINPF
jgi:hypothetical protein